MKLQPLDIKRQTFAKAFRGYDPTEVDGFLKQVADQQGALLDELRQAQDRIREVDGKLKHYERVEMALQEALETARETGKRAEEAAERESRVIVAQAEARAEEILRDAERDRYALHQDVRKLTTRQTEVAARLRGFLLSELEILAQFQGDDPVGFLKLQPAGAPPAQLASPTALLDDTAPEPDEGIAMPASEVAGVMERAPSDAPEPDPRPEATTGTEAESTPIPPDPAPLAPPVPDHQPNPLAASPEGAPAWQRPAWTDLPLADAVPSEPPPPSAPGAAPAGWNLRSLVTGSDDTSHAGDPNVAGSEAERERIRRILEDLD